MGVTFHWITTITSLVWHLQGGWFGQKCNKDKIKKVRDHDNTKKRVRIKKKGKAGGEMNQSVKNKKDEALKSSAFESGIVYIYKLNIRVVPTRGIMWLPIQLTWWRYSNNKQTRPLDSMYTLLCPLSSMYTYIIFLLLLSGQNKKRLLFRIYCRNYI